jgi:hypothetical protein
MSVTGQEWCGRLAQLDRVQASEAWGRGFESHAARQFIFKFFDYTIKASGYVPGAFFVVSSYELIHIELHQFIETG